MIGRGAGLASFLTGPFKGDSKQGSWDHGEGQSLKGSRAFDLPGPGQLNLPVPPSKVLLALMSTTRKLSEGTMNRKGFFLVGHTSQFLPEHGLAVTRFDHSEVRETRTSQV